MYVGTNTIFDDWKSNLLEQVDDIFNKELAVPKFLRLRKIPIFEIISKLFYLKVICPYLTHLRGND